MTAKETFTVPSTDVDGGRRAAALEDWLVKHRAFRLWIQRGRVYSPDGSTRPLPFAVAAYAIGKGVVIVQRFDDGGWDIFVPASTAIEIAATLAAAERALEITGTSEEG